MSNVRAATTVATIATTIGVLALPTLLPQAIADDAENTQSGTAASAQNIENASGGSLDPQSFNHQQNTENRPWDVNDVKFQSAYAPAEDFEAEMRRKREKTFNRLAVTALGSVTVIAVFSVVCVGIIKHRRDKEDPALTDDVVENISANPERSDDHRSQY